MCKKTACAQDGGLTSLILFVFGLAAFVVQVGFYASGHELGVYAVYAALGVLYPGFIVASVYSALLGRKSNKTLCILSAFFGIAPPVGTLFISVLAIRTDPDTRAQELVFNGYAYTYAALGAFAAESKPEFVDTAGEEKFERLSKREARAHIKKLKKAAKTPEGLYNYGAAVAFYTPKYLSDAVDIMHKAAKGGYPPALFNLGYYHETGMYVKKDVKKAREYYKRAADAGDKDARLRLGILDMTVGNTAGGIDVFKTEVDAGDVSAMFDLGVCYETGRGVEKDLDKAIELYGKCVGANLYVAQERVYALACGCVTDIDAGDLFRKLTDVKATGEFELMLKGLIEIRKRHASDAADYYLKAVKRRGRWDGVARCLLGTLYIDSGKLPADKRNGAAYVKSAIGRAAVAREVYSIIPKNLSRRSSAKNKKPDNKKA